MSRRPRLVPRRRAHVIGALWVGLPVAIWFIVNDIVDHGWRVSETFWGAGYVAVMIGGHVWANWHDENSLEHDLRTERRPLRVHAARAKVR